MEAETSPILFKSVQMWLDGETKILLDLYATYLPEIGPMRQFKNKKDMWAKIASEIPGKGAKQCEERYKTVMKRKKSAVDNNNTSGSKRQRLDFEEELRKIAAIDDSVEPEVRMSSQECSKKEAARKPIKGITCKISTPVQSTLMEIAKIKAESRERRHKEKMQAVKDMQDLLKQMLEKKLKQLS